MGHNQLRKCSKYHLVSLLNEKQRSTFANFLHLFYPCPLLTNSAINQSLNCPICIVTFVLIVISWSNFEQRVERWRRGWADNLGTETTPTQRRSLLFRSFCGTTPIVFDIFIVFNFFAIVIFVSVCFLSQVRSLESLMAEKEKQLLQSSNLLRQQLAQGLIIKIIKIVSFFQFFQQLANF